MHATGEPARVTDITNFILLVYEDGQPLLLHLPREPVLLCPVFSSIEKLEEAWTWMAAREKTIPKRIVDQAEFVDSCSESNVIVAADPYIHEGNTRWTSILR